MDSQERNDYYSSVVSILFSDSLNYHRNLPRPLFNIVDFRPFNDIESNIPSIFLFLSVSTNSIIASALFYLPLADKGYNKNDEKEAQTICFRATDSRYGNDCRQHIYKIYHKVVS